MSSIPELLQQGATNAWLFIPSAVLLGALHGLEPGHSKTMMAAFIISIRGTVLQAALLGLSATISHTAVVWIIALLGMHFGQNFYTGSSEGYLQLVSAAIIIGVALWMLARTRRDQHHHDHDHHHDNHGGAHIDDEYEDAHERAHAEEIKRRFANREVTTGQIILFGLTGGLIPCPASITVLLICLQLKHYALGITLVLCFSIGLALTMVTTGALAALSVRAAGRRFGGFGAIARRAPYLSSLLIIAIGLYTGILGWTSLAGS